MMMCSSLEIDKLTTTNFDNFYFYSGELGEEILNPTNFTPEINAFLKAEQQILLHQLNLDRSKYDALLEVGCANARNIHLSLPTKLHYFGIDFMDSAIKIGRQEINRNNWAGTLKCLSLLDLNAQTTPVPDKMRTICLLPFNLFGNVLAPDVVINNLSLLNYNLLLSTYSPKRKHSIAQYYHSCGLKEIKMIDRAHGVLFKGSHGFKSMLYNPSYIKELAGQAGFYIDTYEFSTLGILYYFKKIKDSL